MPTKSELIVDVQPKEISTALLEDGRLVVLQKESRNIAYAVGDLYMARVHKLMPGLNAAFVGVGYEKDAFLHYLDLGTHFNAYSRYLDAALADRRQVPPIADYCNDTDMPKTGAIADVLKQGRTLLVQIAKEPISTKGPRLTTEISFTGRYMILIPFADKINVSQKIKSTEERLRLKQLFSAIKPKGFGIIVRTSAEGCRVADLHAELRALLKGWEDAIAKFQRSSTLPVLIHEEETRAVSVIRDIFSPSFTSIYVNDRETHAQIQNYVAQIAPQSKDIVRLYGKDIPIFDAFGVTRQIKSSFGKAVSFKNGAYIIIESTEALHVVDVNSGNRAKANNDQETNALDVNLNAADEIARQLRLRDMGGIIVIDFIDMAKPENRQTLYEHMREVMATDRARHNILPLSKFGLMQITRQRVRPVLDIPTSETCPSCFGKGEIKPSLLFTDTLQEKLDLLVNTLGVNNFKMYLHPFVEAYVKKGFFSLYSRWRREFGRKFKVIADENLAYLEYKVIDATGKEVDLKEEKDTASNQTKRRTRARQHGLDPSKDDSPIEAEK